MQLEQILMGNIILDSTAIFYGEIYYKFNEKTNCK